MVTCKNERRFQLVTLTRIHVKTGWQMMEWNTNHKSHSIGNDSLNNLDEQSLIIFIMKGMPCKSSHPGSSQYASFNAIYTNYFFSTLRCNLL